MEDRIKNYLDLMFSNVPDSQKARDVKQEMLQNLSEKYNDLVAEGKTPEAAYQLTVDSIGDISGVLSELSLEQPIDGFKPQSTPFQGQTSTASSKPSSSPENAYNAQDYTGTVRGSMPEPAMHPEGKKGLSTGAIIGLCLGGACVLGLLVWIIVIASAGFFSARRISNATRDVTDSAINSLINEITNDLDDDLDFDIDIDEDDLFITSENGTVTTGESFAPGEIDKVVVRWIQGDVNIYHSDAVSFSIEEQGSGNTKPSFYEVQGKTLIINEFEATVNIGFGVNINLSGYSTKNLTLYLPEGLENLQIDIVNSDVEFEETVYVKSILIDSVSSDVEAEDLSCDTLMVNTVSGNVSVSLTTMPTTIMFNSVSGGMTLELAKDVTGFSANIDSVSGKLYVEGFDFSGGESYTYGDGKCTITCDSVSGDLKIKKDQ